MNRITAFCILFNILRVFSQDIYFDESVFKNRLESALTTTRKLFDSTKHPIQANEINHNYHDKYTLAEFVSNMALGASFNSLKSYGLSSDEHIPLLISWIRANKTVTLRFKSYEGCKFIKVVERDVDSDQRVETSFRAATAALTSWTTKVITTVKDYYWRFDVKYEIVLFYGTDDKADNRIILKNRELSQKIITKTEAPPYPTMTSNPPIDLDISPLLHQMNEDNSAFHFNINRSLKDCHTPRRNKEIISMIQFFTKMESWFFSMNNYFMGKLQPVQKMQSKVVIDYNPIFLNDIFNPVMPIFMGHEGVSDKQGPSSIIVNNKDASKLLKEHIRSIQEKIDTLKKTFPSSTEPTVFTVDEAVILSIANHFKEIALSFKMSIQFIEEMLTKQLIAAIGREVTPKDFQNYMEFHSKKIFQEAYQPQPYSYSIRRTPSHSPEGVLTIFQSGGGQGITGGAIEPIHTITRHYGSQESASPDRSNADSRRGHSRGDTEGGNMNRTTRSSRQLSETTTVQDMTLPLSAAVSIVLRGERYLHSWLGQLFSNHNVEPLTLNVRAKQFSSFIVLFGRIGSPHQFIPKYGLIVQNKDDVDIPLDLETIPSPKEFADAIESLSPVQQAFAKAYRAMQLESTLFGICIIQIKPQLEILLNLKSDSLTKEIRLTQDLMNLFVNYQIPSDLLSFDGPEAMNGEERLTVVKGHVKAMLDMLHEAKKEEVAENKLKAQYLNPLKTSSEESHVQHDITSSGNHYDRNSQQTFPKDFWTVDGTAFVDGVSGLEGGQEKRHHMSKKRSKMKVNDDPVMMESMTMMMRSAVVPVAAQSFSAAANQMEAKKAVTHQEERTSAAYSVEGDDRDASSSFTVFPTKLDKSFEHFDPLAPIRPSILTPSPTWTKRAQKALLSSVTSTSIEVSEQNIEKNKAFDLLEAISRSGALPLDQVSVHILMAGTYSFDKNIMATIVQDNMNPIERMERALLVTGSVIHGVPATSLLRQDQIDRVKSTSPQLFSHSKKDENEA